MAGISRYEQVVLGLTAAFVLFTGGWFLARKSVSQPYEVVTSQPVSQEEETKPAASSAASEADTPDSLLEGEVIDINTASAEDLQRLPGDWGETGPGHCGVPGGARPFSVGG